jgi:hypothetical protein
VRQAIRDSARMPGIASRRALIALVVAGVGLALLIALHRPAAKGPPLAKSCTTPAIALGSVATSSGTGVSYAITGPSPGTYVVTADASSVRVRGDGADVTPAGAIAITIHQGLPGCAANGTLPTLPAGPHDVELFRNGRVVAHARLAS